MTGNSVPTGLPVPNPTRAYWQATPHRLASYRSSDHPPPHCDIAIIGTGLAGVATAYHIQQQCQQQQKGDQNPSVVLFEARQACSGATGRNGGHAKLGIPSFKAIWDTHGAQAALDLKDVQDAQFAALKSLIAKENIDCDFFLTRSFDVLFDEEHASAIKKFMLQQQSIGAAWTQAAQWLEGENLEKITGVKAIKGATSVPAVSFWPYKLVTSLLEIIVNHGALLYTETPVKKTEQDGRGGTVLYTSRGATRARKVVFATNGYVSSLLPQFKDVISPYRGQNSHLVATSESHHDLNLTNTYNLHYAKGLADYLNPRIDGTIILGGGEGHYRDDVDAWFNTVDDASLISNEATAHFDTTMGKHFRGWEKSDAQHDFVWTGIQGRTPDGFPHVGRVPGTRNQWMLAGFNGGGMSLILPLASDLARMAAQGAEYEETNLPGIFKTTKERLVSKNPAASSLGSRRDSNIQLDISLNILQG